LILDYARHLTGRIRSSQFTQELVLFTHKLWPTPLPTNTVTPNPLYTSLPTPMYIFAHCLFRLLFSSIIMRPSSLRRGGILRCTLSVRLSVCPSVPCLFTLAPSYERTSKIEKVPFSIIGQRQPCGRVVSFVLFTFQGRITYGHLGRTNLFQLHIICYPALGPQGCY